MHVYLRSSEGLATALGAAQKGGEAPMKEISRPRETSRVCRRHRWRRLAGFGSALSAAGFLAIAVWLCFSGCAAAAAAAPTAKTAAKAAASAEFVAEIDNAFWTVAVNLGGIINGENLEPLMQCVVMFHAAWLTTSVCPVACAGVLHQPLGRAMLATVCSHAFFSAAKFAMAVFALSSFPAVYAKSSRRPGLRFRSSKPESVSKSKSSPPASGKTPDVRQPSMKLPPQLLPKRRDPPEAAAAGASNNHTQPPVMRIQVRRSAKTVPKLWLMAVTAVGGPAVGAVGSTVAWKAGAIAIPAALASLSRGSVFAVLVAGLLCYGGAGTAFVARWAVFQGVLGAPFAVALTPSALIVVYLFNYYYRVAKSSRDGPGPASGVEAKGNVGREDKGLVEKQKDDAEKQGTEAGKGSSTKTTDNERKK